MISLDQFSSNFSENITIQSVHNLVNKVSNLTNKMERLEMILIIIGKFYYIVKNIYTFKSKEFGYITILKKVLEISSEWKCQENKKNIIDMFQRSVFNGTTTSEEIDQLLLNWEIEIVHAYNELLTEKNCDICLEDQKKFTFKLCTVCTHDLCENCYLKLPVKKCPFCRSKLEFYSRMI